MEREARNRPACYGFFVGAGAGCELAGGFCPAGACEAGGLLDCGVVAGACEAGGCVAGCLPAGSESCVFG